MLSHLKMEEDPVTGTLGYADPHDPDNWIDDPCSFCGGESFPATCPGDGRNHHHGAIHPPSDAGVAGYWYLCRDPDCIAQAEAAWASFRSAAQSAR